MAAPEQREQTFESASGEDEHEAARRAALEYLNAVRPEVDHVLQELTDEVRLVFGTDLCMVNLILPDVQYFRAWSGHLPEDLAAARTDPRERSMCRYVVESQAPLVVPDFLATEEFRDQYFRVTYGIRFYAGTPLVTYDGSVIGTLCLLSTRPVEFGEEGLKALGAFARAVVGRLELLGALEREQTARRAEAQRSRELQQTLDSLSAHIAILDETGTIVAVNRAWREFAAANGSDPAEVSEGVNYLRVCDLTPDDSSDQAPTFAEGIRAVLAGGRESFEIEYPCHSPDEQRWFMGRVTRFFCNEKSWAVVAHEDITGRKKVEEELQDQKVLLETILGQAADAIIVCDAHGRFTFANAAARRMALRDPEGTTLDAIPEVWGVAHYPDGRRVPREEWSVGVALRGETTVGMETRMVRPDGSYYDVLISAAPLRNADGGLVGAVAGLLDVTERKRAEAERDRLRDREIEVRAQKEERRRIARDLHDTVLQGLLGALQSLRYTQLRGGEDAGAKPDLAEEIETLARASSDLRGAIHDLRHERERMFVEAVRSLADLDRQMATEHELGLLVEEDFPEELPGELSVQLLRIVQEAVVNARRHAGARRIEVRLRQENGIVVEVADDGRGFDPLSVRAGIGLSAMRERAEAMGGTIEMRSRPGAGTTVWVRVPSDGTRDPRRL